MENESIKVIVIDDESRAIKRMLKLFENFPEVEMIGSFQVADEAIEFMTTNNPDICFLDIEMPGKTGLETAENIIKISPDSKIVFTTSYDHYAIKAIKRDAFDYLLKPISIDELKETFEKFKSKFQIGLSKQELKIIRLIAMGLNSKEIGDKIFLSRHTIDTHRRKILEKTGCKNSSELIRYASEHKLV